MTTEGNNRTSAVQPLWRRMLDVSTGVAMLLASVVLVVLGVTLLRAIDTTNDKGGRNTSDPIPTEPLSIEGAAVMGRPDAPVVLIEFSDFQCPVCARFSRNELAAIRKDYVDSGRVAVVFRHFPLEKIHPLAFGAAEAAECARQQGGFWPMHDLLFGPKAALERLALTAAAKQLQLDQQAFAQCMQGAAAEAVRRDLAAGEALSVHGTPSLLVGTSREDGRVQVRSRFRGVPPAAALVASLDSALAQAAKKSN